MERAETERKRKTGKDREKSKCVSKRRKMSVRSKEKKDR